MSEGNGLPAGWAVTTLGDLGEYLNGRAFSKDEWSTIGRPIIRIQDLTGTGKAPNYYEGELEERYVVRPGDLLISWAATLGAFIWRGSEGCLNQHIFKVVSHIDRLFHYYLTTAILEDLYRQAHGSGMVHITKGKFEATPTSLPPLAEQRRIVAAIEEQFTRLEAGVAALERARKGLKRYRASVLKAAVEGRLTKEWREQNPGAESGGALLERILEERRARWEEAQLAKYAAKEQNPPKNWRSKYKEPAAPDAADLPELPEGWVYVPTQPLLPPSKDGMKTGPFGSLLKKHEHQTQGIPVLGIENIGRMRFIPGSKIHVTAEKANQLENYDARPGDVLVSRSGTVGEVCVVPEGLGEARISTNLMRVRLSPAGILPRYFALLFNAPAIVLNQVRELCRGSSRDFLNQDILSSIVSPLPPLAEQEEIVAEVERRLSVIEEVEAQVEAGLKRAARLRQSILKRAFEGKLVPQDPSDEPASVLLERIRQEREQAPAKKPKRKKPLGKRPKGDQASLFSPRVD